MATLDTIRARCVVSSTGCWEWQGSRNWDGYGHARHEGKLSLTHRLTYTFAVGPIPDGLTIDHLCRVRACCNPAHLEPVDRRTNVLRGDTFQAKHAAQTHCLRGHEFTPANTFIEASGSRRCIACRRARVSAARRARRAA